MNITHIGLVGYGEVGKIFSAGLRVQPGVASVAAWDLKLADPAHRDALQKHAAQALLQQRLILYHQHRDGQRRIGRKKRGIGHAGAPWARKKTNGPS